MSVSDAYITQRFKVDPAIAKAASDAIIAHVGPAPAPVDDPDPPEMQQAPAPPQMQESESPADYAQRSAKYVTKCMCIHENNRTRSRAYEQDSVAFKAFKITEAKYHTDVEELLPQFVAEAVAKAKVGETRPGGNKRKPLEEDEGNDGIQERGKKRKRVEGISRPNPCKTCHEGHRVCRDIVGPRLGACVWCREKKIRCEDPDPDLKQLAEDLKELRSRLESAIHQFEALTEQMTVYVQTEREHNTSIERAADHIILVLKNNVERIQDACRENGVASRKEKGKRREV